jgi:hypothetical protein
VGCEGCEGVVGGEGWGVRWCVGGEGGVSNMRCVW